MDERSERLQRRFEWPVMVAAAATIPILVIQESDLGSPWTALASVMNWSAWLVFAAEMAVMLSVVPERRVWVKNHLIDVAVTILTPPFAPASWQAGRLFRLARLLRLVRLFSLRRLLSLDGIRYAALTAAATVLIGGGVVANIESEQGWSSWDGVWWAATTVTTVGYGEFAPQSDGGRIIAMAIMLIGIGFVALLTAFIADRFIEKEAQSDATEHEILAELREIRGRLERLESR